MRYEDLTPEQQEWLDQMYAKIQPTLQELRRVSHYGSTTE